MIIDIHGHYTTYPPGVEAYRGAQIAQMGNPTKGKMNVTDDEIRTGIRLLAETTGIFTETAGGVTTATLRKLAEAGEIDSDERVVLLITGEGLKTLDAVRGTFETHEIDPTLESFEAGLATAV